ncbi:MAG TPA: DUF1697 domain-containing protein [Acidimicrobiia bacterium]|nr:DUF1697 domain-containing protein [Acidimicrobiia bacterium]
MPTDTVRPAVRVALLRGINVGGNNKVEMPRLRAMFEAMGMDEVGTYINTGNVVFTDPAPRPDVADRVRTAIGEEFGLDIPVLVLERDRMIAVAEALPADWANDSEAKCDVMFLWADVDGPDVLERVTLVEGVDEVAYVPGAILWKVDRSGYGRSGMNRIVGSRLYASMTVRNCNTVRKLADRLSD